MKKIVNINDYLTHDKRQRIIIFLRKTLIDYKKMLTDEQTKLKKDFSKINMLNGSIGRLRQRLTEYENAERSGNGK
jgi:hypothetical protein